MMNPKHIRKVALIPLAIAGQAPAEVLDAAGNGFTVRHEMYMPGCFCEKLGERGGLIHLSVTFVNPGIMLRFSGGLGPLGLMGVSGNMTWEFDDADEGTTMTLQYAVGGYLEGGLDAVAGPVDAVLGEQISRLKALIETESAEQD